MQTKSMWKTVLWKGITGAIAILCSMFEVFGCYPLVPAYFAAVRLEQRKNIFLYIGLFVGMIRFMQLNSIVKYTFVIIISTIGIQFYLWANRKCGGWAAGIITALATIAMSLSGTLLAIPDRNEMIMAASEGFVVLGLTILIHYLVALAPELLRQVAGEETPKQVEAVSLGRQEQMEAFANAFDGLSNTFAMLSKPRKPDMMEEVGSLQKEITGKLCTSCDGCAICWNENNASPALSIHQMLTEVVAHTARDEIVKKDYMTHCPHYRNMVDEAIQAFSRLELNRAWYERLMENRVMIAQQLDAMADMMGEWVKENRCLDRKYRVQMARIQFEVKEKGLVLNQVHIRKDELGHLYIQATVASKWGGGIPCSHYVAAVSKAMGQKFRPGKETRSIITKDETEIILYEETNYYILPGIATRKKDGSTVSGDSFSTLTMDNGQYTISLSDGMGSGVDANRESEMVVELLDKFLEAGFHKETAIKMMNSAMVLQGENNSYSTLDLAGIDLYTGKMEMMKIGAAASFLKHGDQVECISAGSLPAGAECNPKMEAQTRTLEDGDFLVMVTDGVVEYLHVKDPERKLAEIIEATTTENAGAMANEILEHVLLFTGGYALDDMTILVTGFWKK